MNTVHSELNASVEIYLQAPRQHPYRGRIAEQVQAIADILRALDRLRQHDVTLVQRRFHGVRFIIQAS